MTKNILYLGFVGFQNLGDEVCYDAFKQRLALMPGYAAVPYDLREKISVADIQRRSPLRGVVLGGGSLLQGTAFIAPAFEAAAMGLPMWTFGTGVDYFTEDYTEKLISNPHTDTSPQMFEDKELKIDRIKTIISHCRYVGVRGPLTRQFLSAHVSEHKITIIGDPGLIYMPGKDAPLPGTRPGDKFVAVNWGSSFGSIFGHDEARTMAALADGLGRLIRLGYRILIYPMWQSDTEPCARLFEAVGRKDQCALAPGVGTVSSVCRMLREASFSIGFKLHANILSARMGTPFIALAYRSKCYDFAVSIGMGSQCISTSSPHIASFIAEQERRIVGERANMQKSMARYRDIYRGQYEQLWQSITKTI